MYNIIIDCGHGGKDSGAVGIDIREKDYTLIIGKKIKEILKYGKTVKYGKPIYERTGKIIS